MGRLKQGHHKQNRLKTDGSQKRGLGYVNSSLQCDKSEMTWGDSYADKTGENNLWSCFETHDGKKNVDGRSRSRNARVISMKYEMKFSSKKKKKKSQ